MEQFSSCFETTEAEEVLNAWLEIQSNDIEPEGKYFNLIIIKFT